MIVFFSSFLTSLLLTTSGTFLSKSVWADDGQLSLLHGSEIEAGVTDPGATKTFIALFKNNNIDSAVSSLVMNLPSGDYSYLGGSYPGVGGNCSGSLAPGEVCQVMIEHSPTNMGDSDDVLSLSYNLATITMGNTHSLDLKIDGHVEQTTVTGCGNLIPEITSIDPNRLQQSELVSNIKVFGHNFSMASNIAISESTASNIQMLNPSEISFSMSANKIGQYDLTVKTECGEVTLNNAIEVIEDTWLDLRDSLDLIAANMVYTNASVAGYTVDNNYGVQLDITQSGWRTGVRFDGLCNIKNKNFEMVIYRQGSSKVFMPALWSASRDIANYGATTSYRDQFIGLYIPSQSTSSAWGTDGSYWSQSFSAINLPAGKFYRFVFNQAGQNGEEIEIFEVDSALNDISLVGSYVSTKSAVSETNVCPGLTPSTNGLSDYFITALRAR